MKLEDLWRICSECNGEKKIIKSKGDGLSKSTTIIPCKACNEKGGIVTNDGEVLIKFINIMKSVGRL